VARLGRSYSLLTFFPYPQKTSNSYRVGTDPFPAQFPYVFGAAVITATTNATISPLLTGNAAPPITASATGSLAWSGSIDAITTYVMVGVTADANINGKTSSDTTITTALTGRLSS